MNFLARTISYLLNPIITLLPILYVLISKFSDDNTYAVKWTLFSYAFVLAVAVFVAIGVELGIFSNFDVSKREQRPLLFSFSAFAAFCYLISVVVLGGPKVLFLVFFAIMFGLIIFIIVNKWIKASIHLASATAAILFMGIAYQGYLYLLCILIPILAWSRIRMKEHTLGETIVGTVLGVVVTLVVYFISKQFLLGIINS
jgi:hypothetical protein